MRVRLEVGRSEVAHVQLREDDDRGALGQPLVESAQHAPKVMLRRGFGLGLGLGLGFGLGLGLTLTLTRVRVRANPNPNPNPDPNPKQGTCHPTTATMRGRRVTERRP